MEYCSAQRPYVEIKTQWRKRIETNYGDQNFIHHKVESTYLERFKDRNVLGARCAMSLEHQSHLSHIGDKILVG